MDNKDKRSFASTEVRTINETEMTIDHIVNTKTLDRYNTFVLPKGAVVKNFLKNPVVLWLHNVDNNPVKIPIAKCIDIKITEEAITVKTKFNSNDPLAVKVFEAYRDGFLNAWSIGFQPLTYTLYDEENRKELNKKYSLKVTSQQIEDADYMGIHVIDTWELHEYSAVPVPANPEALNFEEKEQHCLALATRGLSTEIDFDKLATIQKAETYKCECIDCGFKKKSKKHCKDLKCPECGGKMRREDRPGTGRELETDDVSDKSVTREENSEEKVTEEVIKEEDKVPEKVEDKEPEPKEEDAVVKEDEEEDLVLVKEKKEPTEEEKEATGVESEKTELEKEQEKNTEVVPEPEPEPKKKEDVEDLVIVKEKEENPKETVLEIPDEEVETAKTEVPVVEPAEEKIEVSTEEPKAGDTAEVATLLDVIKIVTKKLDALAKEVKQLKSLVSVDNIDALRSVVTESVEETKVEEEFSIVKLLKGVYNK